MKLSVFDLANEIYFDLVAESLARVFLYLAENTLGISLSCIV